MVYRIDSPNSVGSKPAAEPAGTPGFFRDGVDGGVDGTDVDQSWLNQVQESLYLFLILGGVAPVKGDTTTLFQAIEALVENDFAPAEPAASEAVVGVTRYATALESEGASVGLALTPGGLGGTLVALGTDICVWDLPGDVWRIQWARIENIEDGETAALPAAFDAGAGTSYLVFGGNMDSDDNSQGHWRPVDEATVRLELPHGGDHDCSLLAIGRKP